MPQVARPQATIPNGPQVTLISNTDWKAPSSNLFNLHAKDGAGYLVETDPLFTNQNNARLPISSLTSQDVTR